VAGKNPILKRDDLLLTLSLSALSFSNSYFRAFEVDIFDPQPDCFHQAKPGTVKQAGNQIVGSLESSENGLGFGASENDRKLFRRLRPFNVVDVWQIPFEHVTV
jgi:hypothetical protein